MLEDAVYDDEKEQRKKRAAYEWVAFSYSEQGFVFYVKKNSDSIYYDEHGEKIATSKEYWGYAEAEKEADAFAERINKAPELAADLLLYTYARDILRSNPAPVSKWNRDSDVIWVSDKEEWPRGYLYTLIDSKNPFRKLSLRIYIGRKVDKSFNILIRNADREIFEAENVDNEKESSIIDFISRTCEALNRAKVKTMKTANEMVGQELSKLGLH